MPRFECRVVKTTVLVTRVEVEASDWEEAEEKAIDQAIKENNWEDSDPRSLGISVPDIDEVEN